MDGTGYPTPGGVAVDVFGFDVVNALGLSALLVGGIECGDSNGVGLCLPSWKKADPFQVQSEGGVPSRRVWPRSPVNFWLLSAALGA